MPAELDFDAYGGTCAELAEFRGCEGGRDIGGAGLSEAYGEGVLVNPLEGPAFEIAVLKVESARDDRIRVRVCRVALHHCGSAVGVAGRARGDCFGTVQELRVRFRIFWTGYLAYPVISSGHAELEVLPEHH